MHEKILMDMTQYDQLILLRLIYDKNRRAIMNSELFKSANLHFGSEQFFFILLSIANYAPSSVANIDGEEVSSTMYIEQSIQQIFCSCLSDDCFCYPLLINNKIYLLANLKHAIDAKNNDSMSLIITKLANICSKARKVCFMRFGLNVHVFIGNFCPSLDLLDKAFGYFDFCVAPDHPQHAQVMASDVITYRDMLGMLQKSHDINRKELKLQEQQIFSSAKKHDFKMAATAIAELIDSAESTYAMALSLRDRVGSIIQCLYDYLGIPGYYECSNMVLDAVEDVYHIQSCHTAGEMKAVTEAILTKFQDYFFAQQQKQSKKPLDMDRYIQNNYRNPDLSLETMSEHFGMSTSHLSRTFRKKYGVNLVSYIHRIRIEASQSLLTDTAYSIKTIASMVGYISETTFYRSFKKYVHITPNEYRNGSVNNGIPHTGTEKSKISSP